MADAASEVRDGMRVEWDVQIPVDDGYVVADVFRPDNDDQHPVLLAASPYAKGLAFSQGYPDQWASLVRDRPEVMNGSSGAYQAWEYPDPERWVPLGYACVRVDTRGTGASPGDVDFFSPQETRDLYTAVEWAGTQPWSSGKVGMLGISYLAINQWQVAAARPPHLAAICPWEGSSDYYREFTHHGGIVSEFMTKWAPAMVETVQHGRADAPVNPNNGRRVTGPDTIDAAERSKKLITIGDVCDAHLVCDEFYRERSPELTDVTVPVLSAANWGGMGLHSRGNFEAFNRVSSEQKWLEVHGLEHWTEFYSEYGLDVQRRFFDHFLKGADNGWDRAARVQLNLRTPDGFVRRDENEWPLARTDWTRLYLDLADGDLAPTAPSGASRASFKARHEVLVFRTPPLPTQLEITGPAALKLFATSTTDDADLFATVHLFDPHGDEVLFTTAREPRAPLAQGWLRMSHRAVDPQRSLPYRPWHPHDRVELLEPGQTYEVDVEIWPTSIIAPAGYSLGVSVRGVDYVHAPLGERYFAHGRELLGSGPYWHEHPGDRDRPAFDGTTTLVTEPDRRPYLLLPIIPPQSS